MDGRSTTSPRPTKTRLGKKYNVKASKTFANFVKFDCNQETTQTSRALIYPSNIINNVMFVSIVWYITTMNRPSQTINVRGTKHITRNGLRISVLDEDLSQARFGCRFRSRSFIGGHLGLGARRLIWNRLHYYRQSQLVEVFHSHSTGKKWLMRK